MTSVTPLLALDSNILNALIHGEDTALMLAQQLGQLRREYRFVICPVVYAEVLAGRGVHVTTLHTFLEEVGIRLDEHLDLSCWQAAANAFAGYTERRRRSGGGLPRRLLADFVVGAHAAQKADALFTADPQHYRLSFPALPVLTP